MSTKIQAPKGTADILPAESWKWQTVERFARETAELFNFREVRTPVFEHTELFHRGVGETSDIVHKETYTFEDRGGRSITLRPEGTAGVVRAMIEHGLLNDQGARAKIFYLCSNFRYENVQKGRLRQHHQFGVEAFGVPDADQDVECILLQLEFYQRCGVKDLALRVNSLGDRESKARYRDALRSFFEPKASSLSEDSQRRLNENTLRILDSKDPRDVAARDGAPSALDSLSEKSRMHFDRVQELLSSAGAKFEVDTNLVRGFDYYTDTLWEVVAGGLGAQNAIGGGGRYDNLVEMLGGRPTPGVGFGSGLERLLIALEAQGVALPNKGKPLVWIISTSEPTKAMVLPLLAELRASGVACDADLTGRKMKAQLTLADRAQANRALILGDTELAEGKVVLKDLKTGDQTLVPRANLAERLSALLGPDGRPDRV